MHNSDGFYSDPQQKHPTFIGWVCSSGNRAVALAITAMIVTVTVYLFMITDGGITLTEVNPDDLIVPSTVAGMLSIASIAGFVIAWRKYLYQE